MLAATLATGLGLAAVSPATAGTVLRGRVVVPGTIPTSTGGPGNVVVYVTEKPGPGQTRLAGRGAREDVALIGDRFEPPVLAITVRSKVRFRNRDRVYHSLFGVSPKGRFELGSLAPGQRREVRFDNAGVSHLFCQLHPASAAYVVVCPNWFHTLASASGNYVLPPLPRGRYVVHAWHPRLGETRRSVEVTGRDVVRFDLRF